MPVLDILSGSSTRRRKTRPRSSFSLASQGACPGGPAQGVLSKANSGINLALQLITRKVDRAAGRDSPRRDSWALR